MEMLTKDYKKINTSDNSKPSLFVRLWKDPVGSKIISVLIIGLSSFLYSIFQNLSQNYSFGDFILSVLVFKIPLYWILILIALSILFILVINYYIRKRRLLPTDLIINMKFGDFKYFELINALNSHLLITPVSLRKNPSDKISLLDCFVMYARKIADGVSINDNGDQEQFLTRTVCPLLEAYGLIIRTKEKNPLPNTNWDINFYYISENGRKFYQALQVYRSYIGDEMEEW